MPAEIEISHQMTIFWLILISTTLSAIAASNIATPTIFSEIKDPFEKLSYVNTQLRAWKISPLVNRTENSETPSTSLFWSQNPEYVVFLVGQCRERASLLIERLEVEIDLLLSDPQSLEDMMQYDVLQLSQFLESHPTYLSALLRRGQTRGLIKHYFVGAYALPLSIRFQELARARKWNSTYVIMLLICIFN
jgi:hypothetical protein